jgi:hypothetical protein
MQSFFGYDINPFTEKLLQVVSKTANIKQTSIVFQINEKIDVTVRIVLLGLDRAEKADISSAVCLGYLYDFPAIRKNKRFDRH